MQEYINKYSENRQLFCCPFMCPYLRYQRPLYRRQWYLHKMKDGFCEINPSKEWPDSIQTWGPFNIWHEALEKRVELAKQGICNPDKDPNKKYYVHKFLVGSCTVSHLNAKDYMAQYPEIEISQSWGPYTLDETLLKQYHLYKQNICPEVFGEE